MSYEGTNTRDLYLTALSGGYYAGHDADAKALAWADAVNIEAVWNVVKRWYSYLQDRTAGLKYPDPSWEPKAGRKPLDQETADRLVSEMEEDFKVEINRWPKDADGNRHGPDFSRLLPHARVAMAQELYDTIKTAQELQADARGYIEREEYPWGEPGAPQRNPEDYNSG